MFSRRCQIFKVLGIAIVAMLLASPAEAHLVTTGLGPVYDGIGHFMLSPDDVVPVIALALLAGLRGAKAGRSVLFGLPPAWLLGGLAAVFLPGWTILPGQLIAAISFLVIGILVAADLAMSASFVLAIACVLGMVHGFGNGSAMREAGAANGALQLIGVASALFVILALVSAFVVALRKAWTRIAVRVVGSWIAAMGLLLLGWYLRKPAA